MTFLIVLYVILLSMLIDTTLHSRCDEASALQQQLELVSELKSDLQDIVYSGKKLLVDYNAG